MGLGDRGRIIWFCFFICFLNGEIEGGGNLVVGCLVFGLGFF